MGNVTVERRRGLFNPFTLSGTVVVDGVVASVQSKWFADGAMDALGLSHLVPALYQARAGMRFSNNALPPISRAWPPLSPKCLRLQARHRC